MVYKALTFLIVLFAISCTKDPIPKCEPFPIYKFSSPFDTLIPILANQKGHNFISSNGLSETLNPDTYFKPNTGLSHDYFNSGDTCSKYFYDVCQIFYHSTLYGHNFEVFIKQLKDKLEFSFTDGSYNNLYERRYMKMSFSLPDSGTNGINASWDSHGNETEYKPEVRKIDSIKINGRLFDNVTEITNTLILKKGNKNELTHFYFSFEYGIIRYVQKDGTSWDIKI